MEREARYKTDFAEAPAFDAGVMGKYFPKLQTTHVNLQGSQQPKILQPEKIPAAWLFYPGSEIKTLCFQRLLFGQDRATCSNRRREDAPRIPLGD